MRLPPVIGHRGAAAHAPENTLAGFRVAWELGASWVEFDVRITADRRLVVIHDETLRRTAGHAGLVRETTADTIAGLDAGAWFGPAFAGERVPTLEAAISALAALDLGANIEMKCDPGLAGATAEALAAVLDECWPADRDPPLVSSFDTDALAAFVRVAPSWPRGLLVERLDGDWRGLLASLGCATLHVGSRGLSRASLAAARETGAPVAVYTVNDADRARTLLDWGAASIITDVPDAILAVA